jgi:DnaJ-domain-containing protein 1
MAEDLLRQARDEVEAGNYEKAERMLLKSIKIKELPEAVRLLRQVQQDVRRPQQATSSSASYSSSSSSTTTSRPRTTEADKPQVPHTPEQVAGVKQILQTKSYYEILGVTKDADSSEIKKAYKKLALKYHPDKNTAPGAIDAFKKICHAFEVLNDDQKKRRYDLYGEETTSEPVQSPFHRGGGDFDQMSPDEIFQHIFRGFGEMHQQARHQRRTPRPHMPHPDNMTEVHCGQLLQLLPILFLLFFMTSSSSMFSEDQVFSFQRTHRYPVSRTTAEATVPSAATVVGINFYVRDDFATKSSAEISQVDERVSKAYAKWLRSECHHEMRNRDYQMQQNRWNAQRFNEARQMPMPNCQRLERLHHEVTAMG